MAVQDKIIAGVLLLHSSLGVLWVFWVATRIGYPTTFVAPNLALAAIGIAAGGGWLMQRRWAGYLAAIYFLVQLVHVLTPTFQWSFTLGLSLNVALGWLSPGELGVNLFAMAMLAWIGARAFAPKRSFNSKPLPGSA